LGIDQHYQSISRGLIDSRDIVYFISMVLLFFGLTIRNLIRR
jgi:ABC-2 type transport system permease protein